MTYLFKALFDVFAAILFASLIAVPAAIIWAALVGYWRLIREEISSW